jgi:hypothetical protein
MYVAYDASNHVLQTLLSKISGAAFGVSEFTLRLPTLLAGFLYFIAVYRLSSLVFGKGGIFLLSVSVLSLNPLLLDLLSAARGYGLALAFCAWALFFMVKGPPQSPYQMLRLAILLALSVSSNVTFLFIDAGLAALFVGTLLTDSRAAFRSLTYFIIPGIVLTLIIIGGPMRNTHSGDFYFGLPSLARSSKSLVYISLVHRLNLPGIGHYYAPLERLVDFISAWFVPVTLCLSGIVWLAIKKAFLIQPQDRFLFFSAGALLFSIGASYVAHHGNRLVVSNLENRPSLDCLFPAHLPRSREKASATMAHADLSSGMLALVCIRAQCESVHRMVFRCRHQTDRDAASKPAPGRTR